MPDPLLDAEHDDVLGRAFDRRLAGRLWAAARPHHRLVWSSIALFPLVALVELAQPYLLKVAIDDYILAADWVGLAGVAGIYALTLVALYGLHISKHLDELPNVKCPLQIHYGLRDQHIPKEEINAVSKGIDAHRAAHGGAPLGRVGVQHEQAQRRGHQTGRVPWTVTR